MTAQVIEISEVDDSPAITLNKNDPASTQPSVNFGGGVELLMNEKR